MTEIRTQFASEHDDIISTCFICAELLSSPNYQNQNYHREYSIRTVFRHLKINQLVPLNSHDNKPVDYVPFCERCYQLFKRLSNYCAELEILQMKISYFLNELNQLSVVEDVEQTCGTIDNVRKLLKTRLEKQGTSSKQIGPLVILPKLEDEKLQTRGTNSKYLSDDDYEAPDDEMVEISDDQYQSSDVEYASDTSGPPKNTLRKPKQARCTPDPNRRDPASSSKKTYPCPECRHDFKCKDSLLEHSPLYHPEKHFPRATKPAHLTQPQYKMYLTHLLNTEVDSCGSFKNGFNCVYCPKAFKNKRRHAVRLHLITSHQNKLLKNLIQLQNDVSTEHLSTIVKMPGQPTQTLDHKKFKLNQFCKIKNRLKPEHNCSVCDVRTTNLKKHEAHHHPEKFLLGKQSEEISSEEFKMYCVHLIDNLAKKFANSEEGPDKKIRFHCTHCQSSYVDLQGCRNHLVLGHLGLLSNEIVKLQQTIKPSELKPDKSKKPKAKYYVKSTKQVIEISTMTCEICEVRLTQRGMAIHMRKNHPEEYLKTENCEVCPICKQRFRYKWWANFHKTRCHPEVLFEKWRNAEMTTVVQFKRYCEYVIGNEISGLGRVGTTNGKFRYECSYCSNTFCDKQYAQTHLVMGHEEILGRKLEELQKSKTVEEIEQGMVTGVEISEEIFGEEEEEDFEETEVFCGKGAVKQEAGESWEVNDAEMGDLSGNQNLNEVSLENVDIDIKEEDCRMDVDAILPD